MIVGLLKTALATDVVGYSRRWGENEQGSLAALKASRRESENQ
jgi:hypothetical protein